MLLILFGAALAAAWLEPVAEPISGRARASDGDSLVLGGERVRLLGIDAPEREQTCTRRGGAVWQCGAEAWSRLASMLASGSVRCEPDGRDRYGRVLAACFASERDVASAMVEAGFAVSDGAYAMEETLARNAGRGIWSGAFQSPRSWRDERDGGNGFFRWLFGEGG